VVTLGVRIGQQVEEDYGVSDKATKEAAWEDLDLQLSVSKNRVLMSMKSFPNNDKFWQYNWTLFSHVVQHQR
jgi:hypothetical protein